MRTLLLSLVVATVSQAKAPPAHAPKAPVPLEEYFKIRRIGSRSGILLSFSHDEKLVAYLSDESGRTEVWVQPIEGGPARQITHVKGFIQALAFSPGGDQLAFTTDVGGDELPHLFLTDSKGTAPRDLVPTQAAGQRTDFLEWAEDGKTLLYTSSVRDPKYMDVYEYDLASGKSERLWEGSGKLSLAGLSRDHKHFVISEVLSDSNNNLYLVDRGSKQKPVLLTPHQGDVEYGVADFSRDAKTLYWTSDQGREFTALYATDLAQKSTKPVLQAEWDVEGGGFSHAWKYFFTFVNADGQMQLAVKDTQTDKPVTLPAPPPGSTWVPLGTSKTDRYLGVRMQGDTAPVAPYIIDLKTNQARRLLDPLPPSLQGRKMVAGEIVHIPSFDGKKVPAFFYKPEGKGPFPAIIDVHGGPTAQSRRDFSGMRQYLLSKGYAVLVPNVRGSTGYGKTWTRLDNHDLGGGPLKDVVACKKWLSESAGVDANRVVVMGGSYGGYMALAAATFAPSEFAANVDFFGVSDLKTLVESFPPYWASDNEFIYKKFGNPKDPADAGYQHDRSPIHFVDKIQRPLLVVQGDRDARVRKDQSDRIVDELKRKKVPVHYLILKDEGHGFSRNESVLGAYRITDKFLDRYLWGDTSVDVDK
jgi:dipeptidyl aminopeptidase/acylaminoacyl peptidase